MLREFMIIFLINYVGMLLSKILHLPLPGTIVSLNMTIFFMPPTVKIIDSYELLEKDLFKIIVIILVSTFLTMGITGKVVQLMIDLKERKEKK